MTAASNPENQPASEPQLEPKIVVRDRRRVDPATGSARTGTTSGSGGGRAETAKSSDKPSSMTNPEVTVLRTQLAERTNDLQRINAEYANYRKRMERERVVVVEHATAMLLTTLLPVLDDVERARSHGDLEGTFGTVAEQLLATLNKNGLRAFGEVGEAFDPVRHEAVTHSVSPDVTEATCTQILRQGYALGERLLRTALVAVTEPSEPQIVRSEQGAAVDGSQEQSPGQSGDAQAVAD